MGLFDGTPGPLSQVSVVALDWPATEGSAMGALLTLRWGGVRGSLGGSPLIFAPCPDCFSLCWLVCAPCSHLATEMTKCRGELVTKELELKRLRRDVNIKASQISRMEESFHCMKEELDSKTELGASHTLCVFFFGFFYSEGKNLVSAWFPLTLPFLSVSAHRSSRSGGRAPPLRDGQAEQHEVCPDAGRAAAGGAGGAGRHAGAAAGAPRRSPKNSDHRGRPTDLCGQTDCAA